MFVPRSVRRVPRVRSRVSPIILFLVLFACAFRTQILAQKQSPTDQDEVLRVTTDLLLFPVRIRDKTGNRSLTERDFSIKDPDGVTRGLYFSVGVDRVAMVFALDQSGSLRDIIGRQRDAALGLYRRFGNQSQVAVLHFAQAITIAAPFARDPLAAQSAFDIRVQANQHTAIFDAAARAVELLDGLPRVRSERRIVIVISDGLDNASATRPAAVIEAAQKQRVSFYVIHVPLFEPRNGRLSVRRPTKGFRDLAEKTGGKYFLAATSALQPAPVDLAPIFQAIEDDLKSQFLIGFYLNEKANDGRRHTFSLSVPEGFEFQIVSRNYSRTEKFAVERPREALKPRR